LCLLFLTAISGFSATNATLWGRVLDDDNAAVVGLPVSLDPSYGGYGSGYGGGIVMQPGPTSPGPMPPVPPLPDSDPRPRLYATTGPDGSFKFEGVAGAYRLNSGWENYPRIYPGSVAVMLLEGEAVTNFVFRVHRANVEIFGTVTGPDGEVFTNTAVNVSPSLYGSVPATSGMTDATGSYRVRVFPGDWIGSLNAFEINRRGYFVNAPTNVSFAAAGTNEVNFVVERPPYTLSGVVVDDRGEPIANIPLNAYRANDWSYNRFEAVSGADGSFSFAVNAGTWHVAYWRPYLATNLPYAQMTYGIEVAGGNVITNIVLPKFRSRVDGVVKTSEGEPMANVSGQMLATVAGVQMLEWFNTDTNGAFSVPVVNGDWRISVNGYQLNLLGFLAPAAIDLSLVDSTNAITFTAIRPSSKLRGTVRDETGAPITNLAFSVWTSGPTYSTFPAVTDEQGRYVVGVPAGKWFYQVQGTNQGAHFHVGLIEPVEVADGGEAVRDITLVRAPHRVQVTLRDQNGAFIVSTNMLWFGAYPVEEESARMANGSFQNGVGEIYVSAGEWRVMPFSGPEGYEPIAGRILTVTNDVSVTLTARKRVFNSTLSGQLVDENGVPVTNAIAMAYTGAPPGQKLVDSEGKFSFTASAGVFSVGAEAPGYVIAWRTVEIGAGTNVFRLVRARKATATLIVRIATANEADIFGVYARTRVGNDVFTASGRFEDGVARIELFPGEWTIAGNAANPDGRQIFHRSVTVTAGEQELTLGGFPAPRTAKIRGRVVDEHGNAAKVGTVTAESIDGIAHYGSVAADGSFEVPVSAGRWWVSLSTGAPYWSYSAYFTAGEIVDGQEVDVGAIVMRTRDVTALTRLRTVSGENPEFAVGMNVSAKRTVNGITYSVTGMRYDGDIPLRLARGEWEFSLWTWEIMASGFANIQPRIFNVPPGGVTNTIVLEPLPLTVTAPRFSISSEPGGKPRLRMHVERSQPTDIESSMDFKTWRLRTDEYPSMGYVDLPSETATNRVEFFRAVTIE
jgi:protocatechuate 3,4-dioxygenase beta subunit